MRPPSDFLLRTTMLITPSPLSTALITCFLSLLARSTSFTFSSQSFTLQGARQRDYKHSMTASISVSYIEARRLEVSF